MSSRWLAGIAGALLGLLLCIPAVAQTGDTVRIGEEEHAVADSTQDSPPTVSDTSAISANRMARVAPVVATSSVMVVRRPGGAG